MQFTTSTTAALLATISLFSTASAKIYGITAPQTVAIGKPFKVTLNVEGYISPVNDVAVAVGINPMPGYPGSLGLLLDSEYLGPTKSNIYNDISFNVTLPNPKYPKYPLGPSRLSASLLSMYGVLHTPSLLFYNVTVIVGNKTSTNTVSSFKIKGKSG